MMGRRSWPTQEGATARVTLVIDPPGGGKTECLAIGPGNTLIVPEIKLAAKTWRAAGASIVSQRRLSLAATQTTPTQPVSAGHG